MGSRNRKSGPPPITGLLSAPLPSTGHPLGVLAHAWLVLNGMAIGAVLGWAAALWGTRYGWWLFTGHLSPRAYSELAGDAGGLAGICLGLFGAAWVIHRAGQRTISITLLTMSFIPFVGPVISVICGLWWLFKKLRRKGGGEPTDRA